MPFSRAGIISIVIALLAASAVAAAEETDPCDRAISNVEMSHCMGKAYKTADAELNATWKQVLASIEDADYLEPKQRKAWLKELRAAQRAWVDFKEHDCRGAVLYEWWGGSGASVAISSCLYERTVARNKDLKQRYLDR